MTALQRIRAEIAAAREAIRGTRPRISATGEIETTPAELIHVRIDVATAATHTLVQGIAGRRVAVYEMMLWNAGVAQDLELLSGADSLTGPMNSFPAQAGWFWPNVGEPRFRLEAGNSLRLTLSAAGQVSGYVLYRMEK